MRSALTTLGIIIGVSAVIAMTEIGQGSSTAVQKTIASMGANNLLIMPGTAASGGVTFGSGSVITLTPQDSDAIARECQSVNSVATVVRARTQATFGNKNWVPLYIYGTTPSFLDVREWTDLEEGELFTDADVRNQTRVCLVGQTIKHELFNDLSPVGREIRMQNVGFRVIGVLSSRGANMMGLDQDDIILAPWTSIKARVSGSLLTNVNQSTALAASSTMASVTAATTVNTLNQSYPGSQNSVYPTIDPLRLVDYPQQNALPQHRPDSGARQLDRGDPTGHSPDHGPAARTASHQGGPAQRLRRARHDRNVQGPRLGVPDDDPLATVRGAGVADRRRRRHHEHHAGVRDRAHQGNWPAHGGRRPAAGHSASVPGGGRRAVPDGRRHGHSHRPGRLPSCCTTS